MKHVITAHFRWSSLVFFYFKILKKCPHVCARFRGSIKMSLAWYENNGYLWDVLSGLLCVCILILRLMGVWVLLSFLCLSVMSIFKIVLYFSVLLSWLIWVSGDESPLWARACREETVYSTPIIICRSESWPTVKSKTMFADVNHYNKPKRHLKKQLLHYPLFCWFHTVLL